MTDVSTRGGGGEIGATGCLGARERANGVNGRGERGRWGSGGGMMSGGETVEEQAAIWISN